MKNKFSLLLIMLIIIMSLVACSQKPKEDEKALNTDSTKVIESEEGAKDSETPTIDAIKKKGSLVLATSADYPPYEWHVLKDGKDEIVGFDIAIAKEIAKALEVKLEVIDMNFEGILPSLITGDSDIAIAGLVPSEERKQAVDFSDIYYLTTQVMLVRAEDEGKLKSQEDYKGKIIGAQLSSTQEDLAKENFPNSEVYPLSKLNDLVLELKNKKVASILMVEPAALQFAEVNKDLKVVDIGLPDHDGSAIAIAKNKEDFLKFTNELLEKLIKEGKIDEYVAQYTKLANEDAKDQ